MILALATGLLVATATACTSESTTPAGPLSAPSSAVSDVPALVAAGGRGDTAEVARLLSEGAALEATDPRGRTALIAAAYGAHLDTAELLLESGADPNRQDQSEQGAYLIATSEIGPADGLSLLRLTLARGADIAGLDSFNGTGLIRAAHRGYPDIVAELLAAEISVNHVNGLGWTALLETIILGQGTDDHVKVLRLLVDSGADVNRPDSDGVSPLSHAQAQGFTDMIDILVAAGAR